MRLWLVAGVMCVEMSFCAMQEVGVLGQGSMVAMAFRCT